MTEMRKLLTICVLIPLFLFPATILGQSKVGTTAAPFLTIGVGSRPQAMGGAFVSMADDAHALFWNPAGLARMPRSEVLMVHSTWLADMSFDFVGACFVLGRAGTLGASATLLSVGEMEITTELEQEGTGRYFDSYDVAGALSYGYMFYDRFSIGATLKYVHQQIWNESASGIAFDVGTLLITPLHDIRLGMNITNFGTPMRMEGRDLLIFYDPDEVKQGNNDRVYGKIETDRWQLPLTMRIGLSGEVWNTNPNRMTLALDWVVPNDNTEFLNMGAEYAFNEFVYLRAGYRGLRPGLAYGLSPPDTGGGMTFGGGMNFGMSGMAFIVDYAFEYYERLGNVHKYSLSFKF